MIRTTRTRPWLAVALAAAMPLAAAHGQTAKKKAPAEPAAGAPAAPAAAEPPKPEEAAPAEENAPGEEAAPPPGPEEAPQLPPELTPENAAPASEVPQLKPEKPEKLWRDIVVVPRKSVLKVRRVELAPMLGVTTNDPLISHFVVGGELNYYLSDVLAVGVGGQGYFKREQDIDFDVARTYRMKVTKNQYDYGFNLNFSYVPAYGKFAVVDRRIVDWEGYVIGGVGVVHTTTITRDPADEAFSSTNISPNIGIGGRVFLNRWLALTLSLRDYIFSDRFEPVNRHDTSVCGTSISGSCAKDHADSELINNLIFNLGVSIYLPREFKYTSLR